MSQSPFSRLRASLSSRASSGDKSSRKKPSRNSQRRSMAFETLERRELLAITALSDFSVNEDSGEKPQSKVWEYNDSWYSVMPDSSGTWVWKLNNNQWQKQLQLTADDGYHADVKVVGNLAHILLFDGSASRLATVEYDSGIDNRYEMWSLRPSLLNLSLASAAETAVLDVDSNGRMWIAYDTSSTIDVRYADLGSQYTSWSAAITVASGIKSDDIGSLIAMPNGTIGVMWSNQNTKLFGFRIHVDGANPNTWLNAEVPAAQSAQDKGNGMADDHIHLAVASDGTLYAAVKTSYDSSGYPRISLLVRRPAGNWDNLYQVDTVGTRPIVMINEAAGKLIVAYTQSDSGGDIYYKESSLQNISFGSRQTLISGSVNNVSSAKASFTDEIVAIAVGGSKAKGSIFRFDGPVTAPPPPQNAAPAVNAGPDRTIQSGTSASLDGTVTDDSRPNPTPSTLWTKVSGPGTVTFGNAAAIDTTATFSAAGTYVLQLTANDGQLSASDTMTVVVQPIAPPPPQNQAPTVSAGSDRSILLSSAASLDGTVNDDGLPSAPGSVTSTWSKISGPGTVTFANAAAVDTTATFSAAGTYVLRLTASDGSLSATDDVTVTVSSSTAPVTIAFQDGLYPAISYQGTRDTKITSGSKNTNYGSAATIDLDGSPDVSDLFYWDVSAIPALSVIESVTIQLNITNTSSQAYELYQMLRNWDESTATWNQAASGASWGTAGATNTSDRGTTVLGSFTPSSNGIMTITLNAAGVAVVQGWVNNAATNRGLIFQDYGNSSGADISTSEASTASQRPKLNITYRTADTGPIGEPEPVNQAPTVSAGADQSIQIGSTASLSGTVNDDGLPSSPGSVSRVWTKISGPGTVTFGSATSNNTTASFGAVGTYVLRLTANDGSLTAFDEITINVQAAPPVNQAPTVSAGADQTIQLPASATLTGIVNDDGLPSSPGSVTRNWTRTSGPGTVTFGNAASASTTASFSTAGTYVLRLTASDGSLTSFDEVTIVVQAAPANQAPTVNAGTDQTIQLPAAATLTGVVNDDGLPSSPGSVTRNWTRTSGPGTVTFGNAASASTTASFSTAGTYVLRLTASDGSLTSFDEVTIVVQAAPANQAPVVTMSNSMTVELPASANLTATVTDVGGPLATPLLTWTRTSGPGTVTFGNASAANTSASFSVAGTYVLRLTASDGDLQSFAEITVTVQAEVVELTQQEKLLAARKKLRG
jgi:PKD repeat protein